MIQKLTESEIAKNLEQLEGWSYQNGFITKSYRFKDFKDAFSIMARIAFECEANNHHPNWENVYNSLTVRLNTHDVDGITENDFNLAKAIEEITKTA
ncbi:MAG: 4a-hydroxytetrahydrobiopterin dehydratase [Bacteroidota bacterium]